jgi:hypothetical protein
MTQFEYLSIATSIVMALGVARLLNGLSVIVRTHQGYWVHTLWVLHLGLTHLLFWWTFWSYREADWSAVDFVLSFSMLCALYFQASSLVPDDARTVKDWRAFYEEERKPYFLAMIGYVIALVLNSVLVRESAFLSMERLPQAVMLAIAVAGYTLDSERAQRALALGSIAFISLGILVIPNTL